MTSQVVATRLTVFAGDLKLPYGLAAITDTEASTRFFVGEKPAPYLSEITEILEGGTRADFRPLVSGLPSKPGLPGKTPVNSWPDSWEVYADMACGTWSAVFAPQGESQRMFISAGVLGHVVEVPAEGGDYASLLSRELAIAWGLGSITSLKENHFDGLIYVVRADHGDVVPIDPEERRDYWFDPPVVSGLNQPACARFGADGETMFVCGTADGAVWLVTNFN